MIKNLPVLQEKPVQSLGQEDPLEKDLATHSSILAWWTWTIRVAFCFLKLFLKNFGCAVCHEGE